MQINNWNQVLSNAPWSERAVLRAIYAQDGYMYISGGHNYVTRFNDIWRTLDGVSWENVVENAAWAGRSGHGFLFFNNKFWIFGGSTQYGFLNDVWCSDDCVDWRLVTNYAPWSPRHEFAYCVHDNKMWLIAGFDSIGFGYLSDVWYTVDGATWTRTTLNFGMNVREHVATSFLNKLWVFGGNTFDGFVNSIYSSVDGVDWTFEGNAAWEARREHALLNYGVEQKIIIVGGFSSEYVGLNDVWESVDAITWTNVPQVTSFSARDNLAVSHNATNIYIFGGENEQIRNDVWESNAFRRIYYVEATGSNTYPFNSRSTAAPSFYELFNGLNAHDIYELASEDIVYVHGLINEPNEWGWYVINGCAIIGTDSLTDRINLSTSTFYSDTQGSIIQKLGFFTDEPDAEGNTFIYGSAVVEQCRFDGGGLAANAIYVYEKTNINYVGNTFTGFTDDAVYVSCTGDYGSFVNLNQSAPSPWTWQGMTADSNNNVYVVVNGDTGPIYMQAGGTGNFIDTGYNIPWAKDITVAPNNDVYVVSDASFSGAIYRQTNGSGSFAEIFSVPNVGWTSVTAAPNGDIYAVSGYIHSPNLNQGIYKLTADNINDVTEVSKLNLGGGTVTCQCVHNEYLILVATYVDGLFTRTLMAYQISNSTLTELDRVDLGNVSVESIASDGNYVYLRLDDGSVYPIVSYLVAYSFNGTTLSSIASQTLAYAGISSSPFVICGDGYIFCDDQSGEQIRALTFNGALFDDAGSPFSLDSGETFSVYNGEPKYFQSSIIANTSTFTNSYRCAFSFDGSNFTRLAQDVISGVFTPSSTGAFLEVPYPTGSWRLSTFDGSNFSSLHQYAFEPIEGIYSQATFIGDTLLVASYQAQDYTYPLWIAGVTGQYNEYGLFNVGLSNIYSSIIIGDTLVISGRDVDDNTDYLFSFKITSTFVSLNEPDRYWAGITATPNGDIYAVAGTNIYKQTAGIGSFQLSTTIPTAGVDMASDSENNVYVVSNNNVYKKLANSETFTSMNAPFGSWKGIAISPNGDITISNGSIYRRYFTYVGDYYNINIVGNSLSSSSYVGINVTFDSMPLTDLNFYDNAIYTENISGTALITYFNCLISSFIHSNNVMPVNFVYLGDGVPITPDITENVSDPMFVNTQPNPLIINQNSPCYRTGVKGEALPLRDILGISYANPPSIGAHEIYTIYYNGNGNTTGTVPVDSEIYDLDQLVTILTQGTLAKDNAIFYGWNTQSNGQGVNYSPDSTLRMTDSIILYAKWLDIDVGGFIGSIAGMSTVTGSYWDVENSGIAQSPAGEGKTTDEMKIKGTPDVYEDWDFDNVWYQNEHEE